MSGQAIPPDQYRHIRAWGIMMGSLPYYIKQQQLAASKDGAPVNAIYQSRNFDGSDGPWRTMDDVTNLDAVKRIEEILERAKW